MHGETVKITCITFGHDSIVVYLHSFMFYLMDI